MTARTPEEKSKKRRKQSSASTSDDVPRPSAKIRASRVISSGQSQGGTGPGTSARVPLERMATAGMSDLVRSERGQSLQPEEQRLVPDAAARRDGAANSALPEATVAPLDPSSFSKNAATPDYVPHGLSAGHGNPLVLDERRPASQPTHSSQPAVAAENATGASRQISTKDDVRPSPGPRVQLTGKWTAGAGPLFQTGRSDKAPRATGDSKLQRRPSLSAFLGRLQALGNERGGEQRPKKSCSEGFDLDGRRVSELMLTVAGVPITKRQVAVMVIFVVVITLAFTTLLILFVRDKRPSASQPLCQTDDCFRHGDLLFANLNRSLNPCEDFSAYVCSAWSPPQGYLQHSNSAMDDVRKSWFPKFNDMLRHGSSIIHAGAKPLAMYSSCMGDRKEYGSNVNIFWNFLHECRLTWPEQPEQGGATPLDVLMTLAFKWQVPLFFEVRAIRLASAPNWRMTLGPGSLIPLMYQHHLAVKNSGGYDKYWATFYFILSGKHDGSAINRTVVDSVAAMEGDVFKRLLTSMRPAIVYPSLLTVAEVGAHTPPLTSEQWLRAFRQNMLVPDVQHSDQLFSPAVDYRLLENRYDRGVAIYRPYFCERFVETAYRFLVIALSSVSLFSRAERAAVSSCFESLVSAAVDMVNASEWLDAESRQLAAEKLLSTRLHLWPPEMFLQSDVLERMYDAFPSTAPSFAEYWVKSSRGAAGSYRLRPDIDVLSYSVNYALPYLSYDAASSSVKVAVGAVTEPLYYADGTRAMSYGGLGFSMALQLVAGLGQTRNQMVPQRHVRGLLSIQVSVSKSLRDTFRYDCGALLTTMSVYFIYGQ
ncbi:hypothetical protein MTO96_032271 [Rhipicephalus appendiculatus]